MWKTENCTFIPPQKNQRSAFLLKIRGIKYKNFDHVMQDKKKIELLFFHEMG